MTKDDDESEIYKRPTALLESYLSKSSVRAPRIYSREEHGVSRRNIDPNALKIMYRLIRGGYQGFMVGGGVRDLLLGIKPKDFDIGTDARPKEIRALFRNSRIIGRRFRLVHIYFQQNSIIEVATFRGDTPEAEVSEDGTAGKLDENVYGTSETDAFRRDLTINALFYDPSTYSVIDYVGGVQDLRAGIIRIIGDPAARFREDPVRLLRCVRHAARLKFAIEPRTLDALLEGRSLLKESSNVRLYEELKKDLGSGCSLDILRLFAQCGLLDFLLPELTEKDSALLRSNSKLSKALATGDKLIREGRPVSSTAVLTAVAMFIGADGTEAPDLRFRDEHELSAHLDICFSDLAVPRKERERIKEIALAWYKLSVLSESDEIPPLDLDGERLSDLRALALILPIPHIDLDYVKLDRSASDRKRRRPRRGRRAGRKPRVMI